MRSVRISAWYLPVIDLLKGLSDDELDLLCTVGNKLKDKVYRHHTGWPGGLKEVTAAKVLEGDLGQFTGALDDEDKRRRNDAESPQDSSSIGPAGRGLDHSFQGATGKSAATRR